MSTKLIIVEGTVTCDKCDYIKYWSFSVDRNSNDPIDYPAEVKRCVKRQHREISMANHPVKKHILTTVAKVVSGLSPMTVTYTTTDKDWEEYDRTHAKERR